MGMGERWAVDIRSPGKGDLCRPGRAAAAPSPIALSSVLEPVADLRERKAGERGQPALLVRGGVAVAPIAGLERGAGALLEAVDCLLAVPYGLGQRELLAQTVLVHCAQSAAAGPLGLVVARAQVEVLQEGVVGGREGAALEQPVELGVLAPLEGHQGPSAQHRIAATRSAGGSAPRKRLKRPAWPACSNASHTHATCSGEKRRPVGGSAAASGGDPGTSGDPGPSAPAAASPAPAPAAAAASPSAACKELTRFLLFFFGCGRRHRLPPSRRPRARLRREGPQFPHRDNGEGNGPSGWAKGAKPPPPRD
ncbi:LOW QUALITY PROTEIN: hypothetical protein MC885_018272 [Smutsia gigantea]|nr:LOW QUALITY PROTEIN: hypothetical protein MC885_018272 [Smutsia gigantea]